MTATTKGTLAEALVAFQQNAPHISLDATNPHFKSKFASLPGVMGAIREPLAAQGLAVLQFPTTIDGQSALRTVLLHKSGEREEDTMLLGADKPGPQAQGSAITYARRYAVLAILGLVGDEDDDGNQAQAASEKKAQNGAGDLTPEQEKRFVELSRELIAAGKITQAHINEGLATDSRAGVLARLEKLATAVKQAA